jgi:hypothetical protein
MDIDIKLVKQAGRNWAAKVELLTTITSLHPWESQMYRLKPLLLTLGSIFSLYLPTTMDSLAQSRQRSTAGSYSPVKSNYQPPVVRTKAPVNSVLSPSSSKLSVPTYKQSVLTNTVKVSKAKAQFPSTKPY